MTSEEKSIQRIRDDANNPSWNFMQSAQDARFLLSIIDRQAESLKELEETLRELFTAIPKHIIDRDDDCYLADPIQSAYAKAQEFLKDKI